MAIVVRTLESGQLEGRTAEDFLREVLEKRLSLKVVFDDGQAVDLMPDTALRPVKTLAGCVPEGWKDAAYGE